MRWTSSLVNQEDLLSIPTLFACGIAEQETSIGTKKSGPNLRLWTLICQILSMIQPSVEKRSYFFLCTSNGAWWNSLSEHSPSASNWRWMLPPHSLGFPCFIILEDQGRCDWWTTDLHTYTWSRLCEKNEW